MAIGFGAFTIALCIVALILNLMVGSFGWAIVMAFLIAINTFIIALELKYNRH